MILDVDKDIVLKFLGYGSRKIPKIIEKKLDEELKIYSDYIEPEYYLKRIRIDSSKKDTVVFDENTVIQSSYLTKKLKDMKSAYVVIYTVGDKIEEVIDKYSKSAEMMRAMIIDKIGIVALDNLRDKLVSEIDKVEYPRFVSSVSYPSQGDFSVENQKVLFELFSDEAENISINEYSQFTPIKTVLLVYGIGDKKDYTDMCEDCDNPCSGSKFYKIEE